jgi:hypothetical protein
MQTASVDSMMWGNHVWGITCVRADCDGSQCENTETQWIYLPVIETD